jgi:hypothetical protein
MAAWCLKIPFGKGKYALSIVPDESALGHFLTQKILRFLNGDLPYTGANRLNMERSAVVCLAGIVAQRRHRPSSVRGWHTSSDFQQAVTLVSNFTGSVRETEAYMELLHIRTEQALDRPGIWQCVEALAAALLDQKALSATEAVEIIRATHARLIEDRRKSRSFTRPQEQ